MLYAVRTLLETKLQGSGKKLFGHPTNQLWAPVTFLLGRLVTNGKQICDPCTDILYFRHGVQN